MIDSDNAVAAAVFMVQLVKKFRISPLGTGLGLAISRGIVEAHGVRIWLDKTYTTGASIKFTLPRDDLSQ
ncbi:MAG: hypothetical protein DLM72_18975 [Candidatus Nitrosopolaris wilkensis]|nr:MAG: hypothetical protein DLM72_18975 [Candidatus Nitrosopolaris wilkensis]